MYCICYPVIDLKEYIKYIFGKFDTVLEYKSNLYKIFGIKNNIGIKADVISKDLLFKNSINFFKSSNHTCTGRLLNDFKYKCLSSINLSKIKATFKLLYELYNCYAFSFLNLNFDLLTRLKNFKNIYSKHQFYNIII